MSEEKITILIVDDSDIVRHSLKNFFNDYDFEVVTCSDGLEGIQKAAELKPAIIFLDLMMPNLDGVKMLQVIKVLDHIKNIPVIVISGNTNRTNVLAAIEAGADKVISKPLQKEIIIKSINELLGSEFLQKAKKAKVFSLSDVNDIRKKLVEMFLNSYPTKKENMQSALRRADKDVLKNIIHEFRGAGLAVGLPNLTVICSLIEDQLSGFDVNWSQINLMCDQVFSIISEIEEPDSTVEQ